VTNFVTFNDFISVSLGVKIVTKILQSY